MSAQLEGMKETVRLPLPCHPMTDEQQKAGLKVPNSSERTGVFATNSARDSRHLPLVPHGEGHHGQDDQEHSQEGLRGGLWRIILFRKNNRSVEGLLAVPNRRGHTHDPRSNLHYCGMAAGCIPNVRSHGAETRARKLTCGGRRDGGGGGGILRRLPEVTPTLSRHCSADIEGSLVFSLSQGEVTSLLNPDLGKEKGSARGKNSQSGSVFWRGVQEAHGGRNRATGDTPTPFRNPGGTKRGTSTRAREGEKKEIDTAGFFQNHTTKERTWRNQHRITSENGKELRDTSKIGA